ncbi:TldD/PmbA family protein [Rickettsiales endosymbiont of Stachyamoeba lipophora]|uniref:TldD/PmbA family protein n=1 Tax=Rickettsiales endosymbiont of Stachyamoeba lipophora TaxID=2486578 RepID=UPI000F652469|nr:metallopeptidase TldD-related protein [Rickettsiales endosymbiont of Stachyamoeba lipophora]AZL15022.1 TldD/PmbA family protein [Rickettsiales endosymbiont of Stachyamoeba lipophora]
MDLLDFLETINNKALKQGATSCDSMAINDVSQDVTCRLGKIDSLERSQSKAFAIRVFIGDKHAIVSSSDFSSDNIDNLLIQAVNMAKNSPEDKDAALADKNMLIKEAKDLNLYDGSELSIEKMIETAKIVEDAMLKVEHVNNSEGSSVSSTKSKCAIAATNGFAEQFYSSAFSMSATAVASSVQGMETDYDYLTTRFLSDLPDPIMLGKIAGERAAKKLNPRKISTSQLPVIYSTRVARELLSEFASSISGTAIARGTSFLKEKMENKIFNENITITDNPHIIKGLASRSFDVEGLPTSKRNLVENGILKSWLLDLKSARKLGLKPTGHATKGLGSNPYPKATNLYINNGMDKLSDLIKSIKQGLLVTDIFGGGVNLLSGNYSQGASGFWIENGEVAYPVSEITLASNLIEMFLNMIPANDLEMKYHINSPSLYIPKMTIAGM